MEQSNLNQSNNKILINYKWCTNVYLFHFCWNCCLLNLIYFQKKNQMRSARMIWSNKKFNFIKCECIAYTKPSPFKWSLTRISCFAFAIQGIILRAPHSKCDGIKMITRNMWNANANRRVFHYCLVPSYIDKLLWWINFVLETPITFISQLK